MKTLKFLALFSLFVFFCSGVLFPQPSAASDKEGSGPGLTNAVLGSCEASEAARPPSHPGTEGRLHEEKLYFDIYWLGIYVGNATLDEVRNGPNVVITSEVHSAPVISVVYKVNDHASSRVVDGRAVNFRIKQREGRYRSNKETIFDPSGGRVTYFDYRKGIKAEHEVKKGPLWDVISAFYHLRTLFLEEGKTLTLEVFDSNKVLKTEVHVLRKEKVSFPGKGKVEAFVVKPVLRTEGLFKHKGSILIWLTADGNRVPAKVETSVSIGKVVAKLKRIETVR